VRRSTHLRSYGGIIRRFRASDQSLDLAQTTRSLFGNGHCGGLGGTRMLLKILPPSCRSKIVRCPIKLSIICGAVNARWLGSKVVTKPFAGHSPSPLNCSHTALKICMAVSCKNPRDVAIVRHCTSMLKR